MDKITLIFSSLVQLARSVGNVPDEVIRELVQCSDIDARLRVARTDVIGMRVPDDIPRAIHDAISTNKDDEEMELDLHIGERPFTIELRGMPSEKVEPMLRFTLRDGRWRFERFAGPSTRKSADMGRVQPFSLRCSVCNVADIAMLTDYGMHGVMTAWVGIRLPVCLKCEVRVKNTQSMPTGACFCCFSVDGVGVYRRTDNCAVMALCQRCAESTWVRVIESSGIIIERIAFPQQKYRNAAALAVAASPFELSDAFGKRNAKRPSEEPLPEAKRIDCCRQDPGAWCAVDECDESVCRKCLGERYGTLAPMFFEPVRLWRCGDHFPTRPPDAAHRTTTTNSEHAGTSTGQCPPAAK